MILQIQYLRGIAALMVVAFHLFYQAATLSGDAAPAWAGVGAAGVDIFFVISGFIMWLTTADGRVRPVRFYLKRILRIVPLYWAVTLMVVAVMLAAPHLLNNSRFDAEHVVASLAFVAWPHPLPPHQLQPVVIPGWTLNYEMFFYALFGLFLFAGRRVRLIGMTATLVGLVIVGLLVPQQDTRFAFYTAPIMLEFAFGMGLGALYCAVPRVDYRIGVLALYAGVGALLAGAEVHGIDRVVTFGLPAALIVFGTLYAAGGHAVAMRKPLFVLGQASYAIYLTQAVSLAAFRSAWHVVGLPAGGLWVIVFFAAGLGVAALVGIAAHRWIELPLAEVTRPKPPRRALMVRTRTGVPGLP